MPTSTTSDRRLRRDLAAIRGDGVAFSLMVGLGETYFAAFALAVGLGSVTAGLVTSVPLLVGSLLQLAAPAAARRAGSQRRWVVACVSVQAAVYVPLAVAACMGGVPVAALFGLVSLYWGASMAAGPTWSGWVGNRIPARLRASFWAERSRSGHAAILLALVASGAALHHWAPARSRGLLVFALLFACAGLCRFVSARCLASTSDGPPPPADPGLSVRALVRRLGTGDPGRLLRFALGLQMAVQIAGPYFTPYMIRELQLPYGSYVLLLAVSYCAKIVSLPLLARLVRRRGALFALRLGTLGIVPLPALWLFSPSVPWLVAVNVASGFAWAAYELAMFLLVFDTLENHERTPVLTAFNVANAVATVGGAVLGGLLLRQAGAFGLVFAASSVARLAVVPLLLRVHAARTALAMPVVVSRPAPGFSGRPLAPAFAAQSLDAPAVTSRAGMANSPRDTTTAAAKSPVTFSVVRHMSRNRSTPRIRPMPSTGTPTMPRMIATTGIDPAGTPAVPMPPRMQTSTTLACCAIDSDTP